MKKIMWIMLIGFIQLFPQKITNNNAAISPKEGIGNPYMVMAYYNAVDRSYYYFQPSDTTGKIIVDISNAKNIPKDVSGAKIAVMVFKSGNDYYYYDPTKKDTSGSGSHDILKSPDEINRSDSAIKKLKKYGVPYIDPYTGTIDEKDSGAVLIKSDRTVQKFSTIKSAIESADAGSTIIVYPGIYSDSITIATNDITIKGIATKSVTISGAVYITASRGDIENCKITGNLSLVGQTVKALYYVQNCQLDNNINVGTVSTAITSNVFFIGCLFGSDAGNSTKTIFVNVSANGANYQYFQQCYSPIWCNSQNLYVTGYSRLRIFGTTNMAFNSIAINGGSGYDKVPMIDVSGITSFAIVSLTLTGWTELSIANSEVDFFNNTTISNSCEFNMFRCKVNGGGSGINITFNSTLPSRWAHCEGTTGILNISGSHMEKLHIQYSFFQQTTAPVGLGSDDANTWGAWTDL
jgi:hypothetical protein